jgi:hypothetical protein
MECALGSQDLQKKQGFLPLLRGILFSLHIKMIDLFSERGSKNSIMK